MTTRKLATKIIDSIMTNGVKEKADRLVLELPDKRNGGGWSRLPLIDRVTEILNGEKRNK